MLSDMIIESNLRRARRNIIIAFVFFFIAFCLMAGDAIAQTVVPGPGDVAEQPDGDVLTGLNMQQFVVQAVATAAGYAINYAAPWVSAQAKGIFMLLLNAVVGCLYLLVTGGDFGWDAQTLTAVIQAVISAAIAHGIFSATSLAPALGAGRNKEGQPVASTQKAIVGSI